MGGLHFLQQGDAVTRGVALLLLAMSVASWVVILGKAWLLRRATGDVARSTAAFWQAASVADAEQNIKAFDRSALVLPLLLAIKSGANGAWNGSLAGAADRSQQLTRVLRSALHAVLDKLQFGQVLLATVGSTAPFVGLLGTVWGIYHALTGMAAAGQITIDKVSGPVGEALIMTAAGDRSQQLTRVLRDALHKVLDKLQFGQVLLATVGSTAPFVGLLGTVWGIYHALTGMATAEQITIDKVSGPVGEALIMTAAGLAVAIPAVLAYNVFGRRIGRIEADLEGFARDLRELFSSPEAPR